jgi:hypothetical protein
MKNSIDIIGNRTCELQACSAVPQSTAPRVPPAVISIVALSESLQCFIWKVFCCSTTTFLHSLHYPLTLLTIIMSNLLTLGLLGCNITTSNPGTVAALVVYWLACWPLVPKIVGSKPSDFSGRKNPQHAFLRGEVKPSVPCQTCGV